MFDGERLARLPGDTFVSSTLSNNVYSGLLNGPFYCFFFGVGNRLARQSQLPAFIQTTERKREGTCVTSSDRRKLCKLGLHDTCQAQAMLGPVLTLPGHTYQIVRYASVLSFVLSVYMLWNLPPPLLSLFSHQPWLSFFGGANFHIDCVTLLFIWESRA